MTALQDLTAAQQDLRNLSANHRKQFLELVAKFPRDRSRTTQQRLEYNAQLKKLTDKYNLEREIKINNVYKLSNILNAQNAAILQTPANTNIIEISRPVTPSQSSPSLSNIFSQSGQNKNSSLILAGLAIAAIILFK